MNLGPTESKSPIKAILIATALLLAVHATLCFTPWRNQAEVTVTHTEVFAPHSVYKALPGAPIKGMHILGNSSQPVAEDNVYVIATVRFSNQMTIPVFYSSATATMIDKDNLSQEATVVATRDQPRLEGIFPNLTPLIT